MISPLMPLLCPANGIETTPREVKQYSSSSRPPTECHHAMRGGATKANGPRRFIKSMKIGRPLGSSFTISPSSTVSSALVSRLSCCSWTRRPALAWKSFAEGEGGECGSRLVKLPRIVFQILDNDLCELPGG